jgi:hypothetical protein
MESNKIEKKFSAGGISATVWSNEKLINGQKVDMKSISLQRTYKDREGNWKHSSNMRVTDLPKAQLVIEKAYEYLAMNEQVEA